MCFFFQIFVINGHLKKGRNAYSRGPNKSGGCIKSIAWKNIAFLIRVLPGKPKVYRYEISINFFIDID